VHERPGAVFEKLEALPADARPSVLAVYEEVYPGMLRTGLVDRLVFMAALERRTVNLSAVKYVCAVRWDRPADRHVPLGGALGAESGRLAIVDRINVAHVASERDHGYAIGGRASSVVVELPSLDASGPRLIEGARGITGAETFTVSAAPGRDLVIVARGLIEQPWDVPVLVAGAEACRLRGASRPDAWSECVATIPAALVRGDKVAITIGSPFVPGQPPPPPRLVAYYWFAQ
jgi:hypothetical protein